MSACRLPRTSSPTCVVATSGANDQITSYNLEFPGDDGRKSVWKDVFHRIFDLTKSNHTYERLGAISAIGEQTDPGAHADLSQMPCSSRQTMIPRIERSRTTTDSTDVSCKAGS